MKPRLWPWAWLKAEIGGRERRRRFVRTDLVPNASRFTVTAGVAFDKPGCLHQDVSSR